MPDRPGPVACGAVGRRHRLEAVPATLDGERTGCRRALAGFPAGAACRGPAATGVWVIWRLGRRVRESFSPCKGAEEFLPDIRTAPESLAFYNMLDADFENRKLPPGEEQQGG